MYVYIKYEINDESTDYHLETVTTKFKLNLTDTVKDIKSILGSNVDIIHRFKILSDDVILSEYVKEWDTIYIFGELDQ